LLVIKGAIFDLGSTLIHFEGSWAEVQEQSLVALSENLAGHGVQLDADQFRRANDEYQRQRQVDHVERTTHTVLQEVLIAQGIEMPPEPVLKDALAVMYAVSEACWTKAAGADNVLEDLRALGLRLGLLSNAGDSQNVQRLVDRMGLRAAFDPIIVSAEIGLRKPHARAFEPILEQWRVHPSEVVMIGDTLGEDILGAQRCGMHQIWVRAFSDARSTAAFSGIVRPETTADDLAQIPDLIARLNGRSTR
jgi:HAD superfamily hydrolase (TIGR01662 family)